MCWVGPLLAIFLCHTGCVAPWTMRAPVVIETSQSFLKFPLGIYSIQSVYTQLVRVTVRGGTHIQHRTKLCTVLNGTDHTIGPDTQAVPTNVEKDETSHLSSTEPQVLIPAPLQTFLGWSHFVNKGNPSTSHDSIQKQQQQDLKALTRRKQKDGVAPTVSEVYGVVGYDSFTTSSVWLQLGCNHLEAVPGVMSSPVPGNP